MPEIPIKYLKYIDNTGNVQKAYGITVLKAVYDADGNTLDEILQTYDNKVGDTSSLTTTANTDLVSAINEVDGNVGDLSGLSTTAKNNLVAAVNELNQNMKWNLLNVYNLTTENTSVTIPSTANEILIFAGAPNVGNGNQVYGGKSYIIPSTEHTNCIVKDKELYNASTGSTVEATGLYCYWNNNILSMRIETGTARARVYYR